MHRLAQLQHQHDAGLARAYALGSCVMPSTATWSVAPIFSGAQRHEAPAPAPDPLAVANRSCKN